MKNRKIQLVLVLAFTVLYFSFLFNALVAEGQTTISVSIPCTNANWEKSEVCTAPVETFTVDPITRNVTGQLTSGKTFTQTWYGSLMLFRLDEVCWLTNGYTTVYCDL